MRVAVFSTKPYDQQYLEQANAAAGRTHELTFLEARLDERTAPLAVGHQAVCAFVNDDLSAPVVEGLADVGVELIALRCAGFNQVDLETADRRGLVVARVPGYSPHAVAEHTAALVLALNRKIHRAANRVRELNFALDGLVGFDLRGRTVGVVGTGRIGAAFCRIMLGFGCEVIASDPKPDPDCESSGVTYVPLAELWPHADIVSLHCPLNAGTHHLVDAAAIAAMRPGVMVVNTSRGGLIDTPAVIEALKTGHIGYLGLDVYEEEADLFFEDRSNRVIRDDTFARLLTFPNVLITGHQGFFTAEALANIAATTIANLTAHASGEGELHRVVVDRRPPGR